MDCNYCGKNAAFKCSVCGKLLCTEHVKLRTVCASCIKSVQARNSIRRILSCKERQKIREFVKLFWGEEEQLTFGRKFKVAELPAYVAKTEKVPVGFLSFAQADQALIIVALGIMPEHQSFGIGTKLVKKVEAEAKRLGKKKLLVSTSNDDLPALGFYQSIGFQIFQVKPNVIGEKHGEIKKGIGGLPVRDELRLRKILS